MLPSEVNIRVEWKSKPFFENWKSHTIPPKRILEMMEITTKSHFPILSPLNPLVAINTCLVSPNTFKPFHFPPSPVSKPTEQNGLWEPRASKVPKLWYNFCRWFQALVRWVWFTHLLSWKSAFRDVLWFSWLIFRESDLRALNKCDQKLLLVSCFDCEVCVQCLRKGVFLKRNRGSLFGWRKGWFHESYFRYECPKGNMNFHTAPQTTPFPGRSLRNQSKGGGHWLTRTEMPGCSEIFKLQNSHTNQLRPRI